jgi:hypothetical protein
MDAKTATVCDAGLYSYAQSRLEREADAFDRDGEYVYFGATGSEEGLAHPRQAVEAGQQGLEDVLAAGGGHALGKGAAGDIVGGTKRISHDLTHY